MRARFNNLLLAAGLLAIAIATRTFAGNTAEVADREYHLDMQLFSMIPGGGLESYRGYGSGEAAGNATVGLGAHDERNFSLEVETTMRSREFVATVSVTPSKSDDITKAMSREFVFSDLQPQTVHIARNADGRIYHLHLLPRIKTLPKPRPLDVDALRLDYWSFHNSPVILNDQDYLGQLDMSSGQLALIDLPGVAKIEFSLVPFRNAEPLGSLKDRVVNIVHKSGTSLRISDVSNGIHRQPLPGGPHQVFVRWSDPSITKTQYEKQLAETIANVRKQIERGDLRTEKDWLQRLKRAQNSDRVMMMSNSLGPIPSADRIDY